MKMKLYFLLMLALSVAGLNAAALAQDHAREGSYANRSIAPSKYSPGQSSSQLRLAAWDDHGRCGGDHDRDDRNCYSRDRDGDRYRQQYSSQGNGHYGGNGYANPYGQNGWYDKQGNWHAGANGSYDRKGNWPSDKQHRDGDDR